MKSFFFLFTNADFRFTAKPPKSNGRKGAKKQIKFELEPPLVSIKNIPEGTIPALTTQCCMTDTRDPNATGRGREWIQRILI